MGNPKVDTDLATFTKNRFASNIYPWTPSGCKTGPTNEIQNWTYQGEDRGVRMLPGSIPNFIINMPVVIINPCIRITSSTTPSILYNNYAVYADIQGTYMDYSLILYEYTSSNNYTTPTRFFCRRSASISFQNNFSLCQLRTGEVRYQAVAVNGTHKMISNLISVFVTDSTPSSSRTFIQNQFVIIPPSRTATPVPKTITKCLQYPGYPLEVYGSTYRSIPYNINEVSLNNLKCTNIAGSQITINTTLTELFNINKYVTNHEEDPVNIYNMLINGTSPYYEYMNVLGYPRNMSGYAKYIINIMVSKYFILYFFILFIIKASFPNTPNSFIIFGKSNKSFFEI
jgi:hypothetical protein